MFIIETKLLCRHFTTLNAAIKILIIGKLLLRTHRYWKIIHFRVVKVTLRH